jgi:hypothetical protein
MPVIWQFFHENHQFFEVFQAIGTNNSLILNFFQKTEIESSLILKYIFRIGIDVSLKIQRTTLHLCIHGWCASHTHYSCHSLGLQGCTTPLTHKHRTQHGIYEAMQCKKPKKTMLFKVFSQPLVHIYSSPQQRSQSSLESSIFTKSKKLQKCCGN